MDRLSDKWSTSLASDVVRDGIGYELLDVRGDTVVEAFCCDADNSMRVTIYWSEFEIPADIFERFLTLAEKRLVRFEDGSPLPPISEWPIVRE